MQISKSNVEGLRKKVIKWQESQKTVVRILGEKRTAEIHDALVCSDEKIQIDQEVTAQTQSGLTLVRYGCQRPHRPEFLVFIKKESQRIVTHPAFGFTLSEYGLASLLPYWLWFGLSSYLLLGFDQAYKGGQWLEFAKARCFLVDPLTKRDLGYGR